MCVPSASPAQGFVKDAWRGRVRGGRGTSCHFPWRRYGRRVNQYRDMMLILIMCGTMGISLWAMFRVKSVYRKFSEVGAASGASGAQVAAAILDRAGIRDVEIVEMDEMLGDHYDPIHKRLVLSSENYHGRSLAALGVSAHECGHAIQHHIAYAPLHWRMGAVGITTFANQLLFPVGVLGLSMGLIAPRTAFAVLAGCWGVIMLFNLVTLPVEFDASRRAKVILADMGFIGTRQEMDGVKRTLDAAGWTYVAAFLTSLAYFLYYLLPLLTGGGRSRED